MSAVLLSVSSVNRGKMESRGNNLTEKLNKPRHLSPSYIILPVLKTTVRLT